MKRISTDNIQVSPACNSTNGTQVSLACVSDDGPQTSPKHITIDNIQIPLKRYSIEDFVGDRFYRHVVQDDDFFIIPAYGNTKDGYNPQLTFLVPRKLPEKLFELPNGKLGFGEMGSLGLDLRKIPQTDLPLCRAPFDYYTKVFFGIYRADDKKYGKAFELTQPIEAKHVLISTEEYRTEEPALVLKALREKSPHVAHGRYTGHIWRLNFVLEVGDYLADNIKIASNPPEIRRLLEWIQKESDQEILSKLGLGDSLAAHKEAAKRRRESQSRNNREKFLPRLTNLQNEIEAAADTGAYPYALPKINTDFESHVYFSLTPVTRSDKSVNGNFFYTEEDVSMMERLVRKNLGEIAACYATVSDAISRLREILKRELSQLKKYHIELIAGPADTNDIWLMHHRLGDCGYTVDEIILTYTFGSAGTFQYDERLLMIDSQELAEEMAEFFRPAINEKLEAIRAIKKISPELSPEEIIFRR